MADPGADDDLFDALHDNTLAESQTVIGRSSSMDLLDLPAAPPKIARKILEAVTEVSKPPVDAAELERTEPGLVAKLACPIVPAARPAVQAPLLPAPRAVPQPAARPAAPAVQAAPAPLATARTLIAEAPVEPTVLRAAPRYEIVRTLGEGAFGRVVEARDTKLGRAVALKILHDEHAKNTEIRQRFLQEAHAAGCIGHPGVVTIFDVGELDGTNQPFIAMEMLAGESLLARLERTGPFPSPRVKEIGRQVASALAAAHAAGVTHRDLKPENLFVVPDCAAIDGERIKVLDFGLAKAQMLAANIKTRAGSVFGTPAYMSPEQFLSTRDTDHRSDIYSLGCILFHLASGRPPFDGAFYELVQAHRSTPPPSLRAIVPDASPVLDALIPRMLAKDPAARPRSMTEVETALRAPEPAIAPAAPEPAPEPARRRWSLRSLFGTR